MKFPDAMSLCYENPSLSDLLGRHFLFLVLCVMKNCNYFIEIGMRGFSKMRSAYQLSYIWIMTEKVAYKTVNILYIERKMLREKNLNL